MLCCHPEAGGGTQMAAALAFVFKPTKPPFGRCADPPHLLTLEFHAFSQGYQKAFRGWGQSAFMCSSAHHLKLSFQTSNPTCVTEVNMTVPSDTSVTDLLRRQWASSFSCRSVEALQLEVPWSAHKSGKFSCTQKAVGNHHLP